MSCCSRLLAMCLLLPACSGWVRLPDGAPRQTPAFKHYQVWSHGRSITLKAVEVRDDSITGLRVTRDEICAPACRVTLPLQNVDSVRTATGGSEVTFGFGVIMGSLGSITLLMLLILGFGGV